MKNINADEGVRTRLILAALDELCEHGVRDFSLRRVAVEAQVSCAAPYRHFKDKEELITETAKYIASKWSLITLEIVAAHGSDTRRTLVELSVAAVRFWIANGNFRSLIIPEENLPLAAEMRSFDRPILEYVRELSEKEALAPEKREGRERLVLALIYGNVVLASAGKLTPAEASDAVRRQLLENL